jgi:regulator of replication initiation timing
MSFAGSDARSLFSAISGLYKTGSEVEAERQMLALKEAFLELRAENLDLRLELRAARESLREKVNLKYEAPFYFLFDGEKKNGPFCQRCYDVDGKKVRLIEHAYKNGSHRCKACYSYYGPPREVADEATTLASTMHAIRAGGVK